jgi:hypothetical protein
MPNPVNEHRAVVDAFAHLSADVTAAPSDAAAQRLRSFVASALRTQLRRDPSLQALPPAAMRLDQVVPESARTSLTQDLDALDASDAAGVRPDDRLPDAHVVIRRDPSAMALQGALIDNMTGLAPGERLGPFATRGGIEIWFEIFFAARRIEVREIGAGAPAIVFTQARPPVIHPASTSIDTEPGTVWIRGDLVDGALPAASFVGIKVASGSLELNQHATISGDIVEVPAPLNGVLQLVPAADQVTPVAGACTASGASVTLPDSLTLKFGAGAATVQATDGKAQAWGQQFEFGPCTGMWSFIPQLWTLALGYNVRPQKFDADP